MVGGCVTSKKYVSSKVNKVRWRPSVSSLGATDTFVAGTWDDSANMVGLWRVPESDDDPVFLHQLPHTGNVNDIQYVTRESFATCSSGGGLHLFQHAGSSQLEHIKAWPQLHTILGAGVSSTALASNGDQIASVGEDGRLVVVNPNLSQPLKSLESAAGCSLYAVVFVKASEVLTANMQGHLTLWDLRASSPVKATMLSPDQVGVCHLAGHPTQQHLVAAGGEDGALAIWDMRTTGQPFTIITAHNAPITEIKFHPGAPEHVFTCGLDGQLMHWDASASARPVPSASLKGPRENSGGSVGVWLSSDVARGAINTTSLLPPSALPINSLDIEGSTLIAGSDNEAIYTLRQVLLF